MYFPLYSITRDNGVAYNGLKLRALFVSPDAADREFVPATRVAVKVSDAIRLALEEYDDFGRIRHFLAASKQSHQLFSVVDIHTRWLAIEAGLGAGLSAASEHRVFKLILIKDL